MTSLTTHESDSLESWALQFPPEERKARLRSLLQSGALDEEEAAVALYAWRTFWARADQIAPPGNWRRWLMLAGRGWGKTRTVVEWAIEKAKAGLGPGHIVARVKDDIEKVLVAGPAGFLAMSPPWFMPTWSKGELTWPNGVKALTFSAEAPDQLRGPQCNWAIADEIASWSYLAEAWGNLTFGLRLGQCPQVAIATTPRALPLLREFVQEASQPDASTVVSRGKTRDNIENLSPDAVADMEKRYKGTRLGRQELEGEILDDVPGALWTRDMLQKAVERGKTYSGLSSRPEGLFKRVVIGVDPSGSDGDERGDFIGIVVVGKLARTEQAVVLQDTTMQGRPEEWSKAVARLYHQWSADNVIAEKNFGGAMVRSTLQSASRNMPVKLVHASDGKHVRAEPVSMLYEQQRVAHARPFPELDDELCFFTADGYQGGVSPNRADAMVWAVSELMIDGPAESSATWGWGGAGR